MPKAKYKKDARGYCKTSVWDGTYKPNGHKHYVTLQTKDGSRALEKMVADFNASVKNRTYTRKSDLLFCQYARQYIDIYKANKEANTRAMYQNIVDKHFVALQGVKLAEISRMHYMVVLNNAQGHPRTQQQIKMVFKQVLRSAAADQLLPTGIVDDIFQTAEQIKYKPTEKRPLTAYERQAVFSADFSTQDRVFVWILYGCGLRRGEALALTTFDVDLKAHVLTVNKAYEFTKNTPTQKGPKSYNGFRTVPIPDSIYPEIERYVLYLRSVDQVQLFTMRDGERVSKSSYDKMWRRIVNSMQTATTERITGLTAHVFRHNYCTNLCYQIPKISIKKIAELLGDKEKMVMEVYNHILLEKEDAAGAVNDAMNF